MVGNGSGLGIGGIIANMIISLYNMIYRPEDTVNIFLEFNEHIWAIFSDGTFGKVFATLKTIGVGLLIIGCLISLMDKVTEGNISPEAFFKHMIKFVILYFVLMNAMTIFNGLLKISTITATDFSHAISGSITSASGKKINQMLLTNGFNRHFSVVSRVGTLIMVLLPYLVSVIYSIVLAFFASSRLIEMIMRISLSPMVVGMSFMAKGDHADVIRYLKSTMGLFFQIVIILAISATVTFTHNALIWQDGDSIHDPADILVKGESVREIHIEDKWVAGGTIKVPSKYEEVNVQSYTKESINKFTDYFLDPKIYMTGVGVLIAALFMIFKSRNISTEIFS